MSDNFEMLVDTDATNEEAPLLAAAVLATFRRLGLITGELTEDCLLDGEGYRVGPAVAESYRLQKQECEFWQLQTSGVEARVGRGFNMWALGPSFAGIDCPACGAEFARSDHPDVLMTAVVNAVGEWVEQSGPALVACPTCGESRPVTEWRCLPPFGWGNLSFVFWNWPPLDSPSWTIDIAAIVREATGHTIVETHGHL